MGFCEQNTGQASRVLKAVGCSKAGTACLPAFLELDGPEKII
jgi:hypothetical protein